MGRAQGRTASPLTDSHAWPRKIQACLADRYWQGRMSCNRSSMVASIVKSKSCKVYDGKREHFSTNVWISSSKAFSSSHIST